MDTITRDFIDIVYNVSKIVLTAQQCQVVLHVISQLSKESAQKQLASVLGLDENQVDQLWRQFSCAVQNRYKRARHLPLQSSQ